MDWKKFRDLDAVAVDTDGLYYDGGYFESTELLWDDIDSDLYAAIQSEDVDIWHDDTPAVQEVFRLLFEKVGEDIYPWLFQGDVSILLDTAGDGTLVGRRLLYRAMKRTGLSVEDLIAIASDYYSSFEECLEALSSGDALVKVVREEALKIEGDLSREELDTIERVVITLRATGEPVDLELIIDSLDSPYEFIKGKPIELIIEDMESWTIPMLPDLRKYSRFYGLLDELVSIEDIARLYAKSEGIEIFRDGILYME